jgi:PIN domain-containing protein
VGKARARPTATSGLTVDAGALIALDRGDRRMIALLAEAIKRGLTFRVPAGVVGQAWREGSRQVSLARFLAAQEVHVVPLDEQLSRACGELCGQSGTADVIDASVVIVAREQRDAIVTGDADDLRRLDPSCTFVEL